MVDFNRVGQLMRQAGADLSGQGLQFRQQQMQEQELARQRAQSLDDQRKKALAIDARLALNHLNNNDLNSFGRLVQNRIENVQRLGGDPTDTLQIADMVSRGEIDQAKSLLGDIDQAAVLAGFLPKQDDMSDKTAAEREFTSLTKGMKESDIEKAKRIRLGLDPRASSRLTIDEQADLAQKKADIRTEAAIKTETGKLQAKYKLTPKIRGAVEEVLLGVRQKADIAQESRSDAKALDVYETATSGLMNALADTMTGPVTGWLPAVTTSQQIADGAVAAMAPTLKQLFRSAGEGTFTDFDQALLMQMVPTRKDSKEAARAKITNIDAIVRAKLGQPSETVTQPSAPDLDLPTLSDEEFLRALEGL